APFGEGNFRDEVGLHPMRALGFEPAWRIHESGLVLFPCEKKLVDLAKRLAVEPRADLAGVAELAIHVDAEEQSAEPLARPLRIGKTPDHHLLPLRAFDLHPLAGAKP